MTSIMKDQQKLIKIRMFTISSFFLMEIGENLFQSIYLVNLGWNEGAIGKAMSLMTFTALFAQTFSGDVIDKTTIDRRYLLSFATICSAFSYMSILLLREGNVDHHIMYIAKVVEGIANSFIGPCLAALSLTSFGPDQFDEIMTNNTFWGHIGKAVISTLAGMVAYWSYPDVKYSFYFLGLCSIAGILPFLLSFSNDDDRKMVSSHKDIYNKRQKKDDENNRNRPGASYISVILERKTLVICITGFFLQLGNTNVMYVLSQLMANNSKRASIPLSASAILLSQAIMACTNKFVERITNDNVRKDSNMIGRKTLYLIGLSMLPIRCALILYLRHYGSLALLLAQIFDGFYGGFCGLVLPFIIADITFGTGRFGFISGMVTTCLSLGRTLSTLVGQFIVEHYGHVASLYFSLFTLFIPLSIFGIFMPETLNTRKKKNI